MNNPLGRLAVLVVDDHRINREWLHAGLRHRVARVALAENGAAAIERCREETFDVVLMDLHMPGMDGRATADRIRDLAVDSSRPRLIALTAEAGEPVEKRSHGGEFDACLSKPVGLADVIATIERLMTADETADCQEQVSDPAALIDRQRALSAAHGDAELVRQLQTMLAKELRTRRPVLEHCLLRQDWTGAGEILHQWIGACGYAGARRLAGACRALRETLDRAEPRDRAEACVRFLRTAEATETRLRRD